MSSRKLRPLGLSLTVLAAALSPTQIWAQDVGGFSSSTAAAAVSNATGAAPSGSLASQLGNPGTSPSSAKAQSDNSAKGQTQTEQAANAETGKVDKAESLKNVAADQTEFQRFVEESTGKALPLFGYQLFNQPGQYAPVLSAPVPGSYLLGPGDELVLQTFGLVDMAERLVLDREGKVNIPRVGPLMLAGMPFAAAEKALTAHIGKVYTNFTLSLSMGRVRSIEVFVVGQARQPGKHIVSGLSTLINALFETGGPAINGSLRQVQLRRGGQTIATVDLYKFLAKGDTTTDIKLQSGDIIVIPPAGARAALLGMINMPAIYELKAGESVQEVLDLSGGLPVLASPQEALLERLNAQRDIPRYVEDFALDANGLKRTLQGGDVLTVFQISPQIANIVTLEGHVAAPMRYTFKPGMKVSELLSDPRQLIPSSHWQDVNRGGDLLARPMVNLDYATIKRHDPVTLRSQLITFNLGRAMAHDAANDLTLQVGDIVTVYSSNDIAVPMGKRFQQVRLEGEVNIPGTYPIQPGETLQQLIQRAGGLTPNAYLYGTTFSRESTRQQQQANLEKALRRAESDLSSQTATLMQNQTKDNPVNGQVLQQQQELARLRGLKANGRIALEISPFDKQTPTIKLENGDRIAIPSSPDFVGVMGAVLAETAFLYRPNDTVGDYLDRAGITRDADLDSLMIIRANGSVESAARSSARTLWGMTSGLQSQTLFPGDTLFVPEKVDRRSGYTKFIEGAKDWTSLFYQFGLGAAAIKTLKN